MDEYATLLLGVLIGALPTVSIEVYRQRSKRQAERDELSRSSFADFIGLATSTRDLYQELAMARSEQATEPEPAELRAAESSFSQAYHRLSLVASEDSLDRARQLRSSIIELGRVAKDGGFSGEDEIVEAVNRAMQLRRGFRDGARKELGLT